jgi:Flp pilus assembly protein TadG
MKRRGSQAIEFGLALPMLLVLSAGTIDVGQYLYASERVASVASEGARSGALADPDLGEDPIAIATDSAQAAWAATELAGVLTVDATLQGAAPNLRVVVQATVDADPVFGLFSILPTTMTATRTVRISDQD